jgi:hypothetical protein
VTDIPAVVPPEPPAPPVLPVIVAPTPPAPPEPPVPPVVAPVLTVGAPVLSVEALMPVDDLTPVEAPPTGQLTVTPRDDLPRAQAPWRASPAPEPVPALPAWRAFASVQAAAKRATPSKPRDGSGQPRRARQLVVLGTDAPAGGGGAASGGGSGNGGSGGTAALAPWLLLSFLGYAALRLPAGRRTPRAPVEDIDVRPG